MPRVNSEVACGAGDVGSDPGNRGQGWRHHPLLPTVPPPCSAPILPHPALRSPPYPALPFPTLPYPTLPYPSLPYPTLLYPDLTVPYPTLPCPTLHCPTLPCLPHPTLPYPTLPKPTLPFSTRPDPNTPLSTPINRARPQPAKPEQNGPQTICLNPILPYLPQRGASRLATARRKRDFFIDNLLVRIHIISKMIWWTGLAL